MGIFIVVKTDIHAGFRLIVHPKTPDYNSAIAFNRLLNKIGLEGFKNYLNTTALNLKNIDRGKLNKLKEIFSKKCVKGYRFFVDFDDMSKENAFEVLSQMKSEIDSGKDMMEVYKTYATRYKYLKDPKFPKHYVTKVGNGGEFYLSEAIMNTFPIYFQIKRLNSLELENRKDRFKKILALDLNSQLIVEETISQEDKKWKDYSDNMALETKDRYILYIVTDVVD